MRREAGFPHTAEPNTLDVYTNFVYCHLVEGYLISGSRRLKAAFLPEKQRFGHKSGPFQVTFSG